MNSADNIKKKNISSQIQIQSIKFVRKIKETPLFPLGIAALRRRNLGKKLVAGSIPLKGHF